LQKKRRKKKFAINDPLVYLSFFILMMDNNQIHVQKKGQQDDFSLIQIVVIKDFTCYRRAKYIGGKE